MAAHETPLDRLTALLEHFRVRAHLFYTGPLCGVTRYPEMGHGFLHVLRRGEMEVTHTARSGAPRRVKLKEPTLLFYPRPLAHAFHNAPVEGSDFTCAALHFDGGVHHPLVRALPAMVMVPLHRVPGLGPALDLLFAETDQVRCGSKLLADRLFEVVLIQLMRWLIDHHEEAGISPGLIAGLSHPKLARALVAMHAAPGQAWSLAAMAEEAGMSRSAFAASFKEVMGIPPAEHLTDWRLTLARAELARGRPVKAIADELGYANASALSRVFTERLGLSPRAWLQREAARQAG
ncbi:MAG: AraC family transcriptional regulator [Aquabacterium sp.]